jgi:hypothetical protein
MKALLTIEEAAKLTKLSVKTCIPMRKGKQFRILNSGAGKQFCQNTNKGNQWN